MQQIYNFVNGDDFYGLHLVFYDLFKDVQVIQVILGLGEGNRTNYDVSYETGISMKTLEILSFKFIVLMFSLISHEICMLDGSIYSTFLH